MLFSFDDAYLEAQTRPTLSQSLVDRYGEPIRLVKRVVGSAPPFFSNLLPDEPSPLRASIARERGISPTHDFLLLEALGADLPGAVTIGIPDDTPVRSEAPMLRVSLSGSRSKFGAAFSNGRFSIAGPASAGTWIVKTPERARPGLIANEFAIMTLAAKIGLDVPRLSRRSLGALVDVPTSIEIDRSENAVYAIERFDRSPNTGRVHVEDFAQIFGRQPERRREGRSSSEIASVVAQICPRRDVDEFVRRLVFGVCIGNGGMHLKKWAVRYADERVARLAPMYGFVCTRSGRPDSGLALPIGDERAFERISRETMRAFARQAEISQRRVDTLVIETVERVRDAWLGIRDEVEDPKLIEGVESTFAVVPLVRDVIGTI